MSRHSQISRCAPIGLKNFSKLDDAEKLTKSIYILNIVNELKKFFFFIEYLIYETATHIVGFNKLLIISFVIIDDIIIYKIYVVIKLKEKYYYKYVNNR